MKILAPAGNFESLKVAVYHGADEVYLGINDFNARNNIDGFTIENLIDAVDFAHLFGVKVHLAINILFSDSELQSAVDTLIKAYNLGVDAFIVQDLGLAKIISENYPEIELHASTQMGLHNLEGVKAVEKYGFSRVVLARETPLNEIERIKKNSNVEIEYFAQGALCVSFSGNCYMSSYYQNASGNRGKCKQLCRLPYSLVKGGKTLKKGYLLSAKEFNLSDRLNQLKKAGVNAIKIEGRARRPYYVGAVTAEYRKVLDGKNPNQENLKLAFNRGYTAGYFDGNGKIISEIQNHVGIFIGNVKKVVKGKNFNQVYFSSNRELSPKSTFKVFDGKGEKLTLTAFDLKKIDNGYQLTTTHELSVGDKLNLIIDAKRENEILTYTRKRNLEISIFAVENQKVKATLNVDGEKIEIFGDLLSPAKNQPLTEQDFKQTFAKSELFFAHLTFEKLGNVFMAKSALNAFRRKVFDKIYCALTEKYRKNLTPVKALTNLKVDAFSDFNFVYELDQEFSAKNVIYSPEQYNLKNLLEFIDKCKKLNKCAYLDTPNFALKEDILLLQDVITKSGISVVANNYYALLLPNVKVIGGGLNVYNSVSASEYSGKKIISAESGVIEKTPFPVMTLRHCPLKAHLNSTCDKCLYQDGFSYVLESGKSYKLKRKKLSTCTFYLVD
ncbi:MAG: U32 family peptidase [Clostridiales bacterium]|nr:U32 family peptidase [Clostridiales bacterium]